MTITVTMRRLLVLCAATLAWSGIATAQYSGAPYQGYFNVSKIEDDNMVIINAGRDQGLKKGTIVCFFNDQQQMSTCAKVVDARSRASKLKIGEGIRLRVGSAARVASACEAESVGISFGVNTRGASYFHVGYVYAITLPFKYNYVQVNPLAFDDVDQPFWQKTKTVTSAQMNFTALVQMPITDLVGMSGGIIARQITDTPLKKTYGADGDKIADYRVTASGVGFPARVHLNFAKQKFMFPVAAGFQLDHSQVRFRAYTETPGEGDRSQLASALSTLNTVSTRLDGGAGYKLGAVSYIGLDVGLIFPMTSFNSAKVAFIYTPPDVDRPDTGPELSKVLGHGQSSMGIDLTARFAWGF